MNKSVHAATTNDTKEEERRKAHLLKMREVLDEVIDEREFQRKRWNEADKRRTPEDWVSIVAIYLGKAAMETATHQGPAYDLERFRKRLKQMAALCIAGLEAL